ncbi:glycosyltransferase family 2 protein [Weissella koreensis]|uniref:Glycosyltransferase family 2 protein n=1 Tax=Weissella koreensis TaxID=165096 RepID=A0A7H1ML62_9LACO|nr:glycosyltransferase family 2 protein [Weissella koreensis]AVH74994.1 glycosyltransferase family 2 protein [Weissella koreensis]QGN20220.1 glycosyltransferase [Weissella koreensis]QNT64198.1 glycosyltransferase family 2 protein [Weissella koreensis]
MNRSKVSVVMSTYNGDRYLENQLDSILNQKFDNQKFDLKIYIRDDGSKDNTQDIIDKYVNNYPDIVNQVDKNNPNIGVKQSFFKLLKLVDGDYYFFSDQDDIWLPNKLDKFLEVFSLHENNIPVGVYSDLWVADANGVSIGKRMKENTSIGQDKDVLPNLLNRYLVTGASFAINKKTVEYVNEVNEEIFDRVNMHDSFIGLLVAMTGSLEFIDEPLVNYRQHGNNVVGAHFKPISIVYKLLHLNKMRTSKKQQILNFYLAGTLFKNNVTDKNKKLVMIIDKYVNSKNYITKMKVLLPIRKVLSRNNPNLSLLNCTFLIKFSKEELKVN